MDGAACQPKTETVVAETMMTEAAMAVVMTMEVTMIVAVVTMMGMATEAAIRKVNPFASKVRSTKASVFPFKVVV